MQETQPSKERSITYQILFIEETRKNVGQLQEITKLLEDMIPKEYYMEVNKLYDGNGDVIGLAGLRLTEAERNFVGGNSGVQCIEKDFALGIDSTEATDTGSQSMNEIPDPIHSPIEQQNPQEATSVWDIQRNADKALIRDCQYPGSVALGHDFVHRSNPGQSTFIYVLGWGVQLKVLNRDGNLEFKQLEQGQEQGIMTRRSHMWRRRSLEDGDPHSHGTIIASKAAGRRYGLAKQATIISVRSCASHGDWENSLALVLENLRQHPERQSRSVVLSALGPPIRFTYIQAKNNPAIQGNVARSVKGLVDLGVPFVTASGNDDESRIVDRLPQVLDDDDIPLIVVGAACRNNRRTSFTQVPRDGRPIVYAPGTDVECQTRYNRQFTLDTGTSVAAPQVAGLIATYLSDNSRSWPWEDKNGLERIVAIRDYLMSDHSSWVRPGGVRMIWNGATKEAHESVGP